MRSEKQIAASRANGKKSRGPVTSQGRINSSKNRTQHGLLARTVVLDTENKGRFHELLNSFQNTYLPKTPTESVLVEKMAVAHWRLMRLWSHQKAAFALELREQPTTVVTEDTPTRDSLAFASLGPPRSPSPALMDRYEITYDRQFARALRLLRWEQQMRIRTQQLIENIDPPTETEPQGIPKNP
jgi:hypothetical protein